MVVEHWRREFGGSHMLTERLSEEEKQFQRMTWRAKRHGGQVVEREIMQQFTATIAEQDAILAAARRRPMSSVS